MFDKLKDAVVSAANRVAYGKAPEGGPGSLEGVALQRLSGGSFDQAELSGKVVLFVNVASKCGLTPQYEGLEEIYRQYKDKGVVVLGFPCNQFGGQEPGAEGQIAEFCRSIYGVEFPMFSKLEVNGPGTHPVFQFLKEKAPGLLGSKDLKWNFTKFLVSPDGETVKRYAPQSEPKEMVPDIEAIVKK